ncbi:MAG: FG-GAP-like repeat-containing protein [Terriglobales bacterium]|jgi:hypothetical protein
MKTLRLVSLFATFLIVTLTSAAAQTGDWHADAKAPKQTVTKSVKPGGNTLSPTFANAVEYDSGGIQASNVVMADFNRDGIPDMVVCNTNGYSVFLGNGDGTFNLNNTYTPAGTGANFCAVGDLNGDGNPDIVATTNYDANGNAGGVDVLLGNGDGTFQGPVSYIAGGLESFGIAIGDVNNDGFPDVIVTSRCQVETCINGNIFLLLGKGNGTFRTSPEFITVAADNGGPIALADLNGDGNLDIVASAGVLLGDGTGNFTPAADNGVYIPGGATAVAVADVNGDGKLDVAVATSAGAYMMPGNGDGTLQAAIHYAKTGGTWPLGVALGDVNDDGHPDLLIANECQFIVVSAGQKTCSNIGTAGVMTGNGDGTFNPVNGYLAGYGFLSAGQYTTSIAVSDVNGDGKPDLIVTNSCYSPAQCAQGGDGSVSVLINTTVAPTTTTLTPAPNPSILYQSVLLTATTTSLAPIKNGDIVTFYDGTNVIGTGTTTNGVATVSTTFTPAGKHYLKAAFAGDIWNAPSTGLATQVVALLPSTTIVTSTPNPSTYRQSVTMTATVSSAEVGGPTGTVTFKNGSASLGTVALSGGVASMSRTTLTVGSHTITATYNGDSQSASSSGSTTQTVN